MRRNRPNQVKRVFAFNRVLNTPVDGDAANITCQMKIDDGALTPLTDTNPQPSGVPGYYDFDLEQEETDGYELAWFPVSSTPDVQVVATHPVDYTTGSGLDQEEIEISVPAPVSPIQTNAYTTARNAAGVLTAGIKAYFKLVEPTGASGVWSTGILEATSDADGYIVIALARLSRYLIANNNSFVNAQIFKTTDTETFQIPVEVIG